jgi:glucosylceramidase
MKNDKNCVKFYFTSVEGARLKEMEDLPLKAVKPSDLPVLTLDTSHPGRTLDGFGATFNEAGWAILKELPVSTRREFFRNLFDPREGAGFSLCASPVGHNDFSLDYYSYNESIGDEEMRDFSIRRDQDYLIPYIREALAVGSFQLVCRPDFPPAWMLDDQKRLAPRCYAVFAHYLSLFVLAYKREGIPVNWISMFNEPRIYVNIGGEELRNLIRDHVGPLFRKEHPDVGLQVCDSYNRDQVKSDWQPSLEDPETRRYVDGAAYHSYHWEYTSIQNVKDIAMEYPELKIWQTEVAHLYTRPVLGYHDGELWGKMIADDLNHGASGWIFWNMLLDQEGGPWNQHPFNPGYPQDALAVYLKENESIFLTSKFYYLSHFSRFIRPGARVIPNQVFQENKPFPENALYWFRIFTFRNPDGKLGLVVMNTNDDDNCCLVRAEGQEFLVNLPGHSIASCLWGS